VKGSFAPRPDPSMVIGTDELRAKLGNRDLALIDTRSTDEYERQGHIPGARLLDWSRTFVRPEAASNGEESPLVSDAALLRMFRDAGAETDRDLVLYCTIGLRAAHMYFVARYLGFNPRLYDRSIEAWRRRPDLPLRTGGRP
jgi:thiosulfate/3-mercaptopyruvate sulfurtransferase